MGLVMEGQTTAYYNHQAEAFVRETQSLDMSRLYERFLPHLPSGAHILDAGCGSGRDTRAFLERGFTATAFDASPAIASLAEAYLEMPVTVMRVQEIDWSRQFDGIWACASLLHVSGAELPAVMRRLAHALKPGGLLYASFKYGEGEQVRNGRQFIDLDEIGLADLLRQTPELIEVETWVTGDVRPGRESERWLNTLLQTRESA
jgi:SAM-dependent methyltransferase